MSLLVTLVMAIWGVPLAAIGLGLCAAGVSSRARLFFRRTLVTG